ncbi:MAG: N-acetylneuraminate synthase [Bacteroidetes bacterium HGW-Bacteroidetes-8]|jgi:N-acetylneuraminate synthase|nr:MAG: N-acetylneuraminate synthase [Bacteroidetes bacterium HGW-Bacteroidetes-8]
MRQKVSIIAEAGVNHNGSMELAKMLVKIAAEAGADIVKFQTFKADKLVSKSAKKAEYQRANLDNLDNYQYNMLKYLELDEAMHLALMDYCKQCGITFLSTGFDEESIDMLDRLKIPFFKVPSGEITNKPYLQHIAKKGKPVVLSTGMADLNEIKDALEVLTEAGLDLSKITVLHCNTEYPTPMQDVNLKAMNNIRETFGVKIGYSDHTVGIEVPIAAVALGAEVIEKHFTLDRNLEGPDHKASLEPDELKAMVKAIRNIELAMRGSGIKETSKSEETNKTIARKSIHISTQITAGETILSHHLIMKRPGDGISPMLVDEIVGKIVKRDIKEDEKLNWEDLEL